MPIFTYSARSADGDLVSGTLDATNIDSANAALRSMDLMPEQVYESFEMQQADTTSTDTDEFSSPWQDPSVEKELEAATKYSFDTDATDKAQIDTSEVSDDTGIDNSTDEDEGPVETVDNSSLEDKEELSKTELTNPYPQWSTIDEDNLQTTVDTHTQLDALSPHLENEPKNVDPKKYYPLSETFRLYAGWLLAWYGMVYSLGYYQSTRDTALDIPYVEGLIVSPLVLTFTLAAFLYLLLSTIHTKLGKGGLTGFGLTIVGLAIFVLYRMNV